MHKNMNFKPHPLLVLLTATAAGTLMANPQAPLVVQGQASFQKNGNALTVTNTPGTIINWQQFNIDRGELTRFVQQSASSQVLNRVVGVDPSVILGTLQSNGRVFLVNPNGIVFGAGSQVDVAGLVASTLRLSNDDFNNGRLRFTDTPGAGGIRNEGNIRSATGGEVLLIAPRIENSGLIQAPDGKILLAAGRSVEVADIDRPNIRVEITNTDEEAINLGTLMARSISIYGGLIRNSGRIQASSAVVGENGKVILQARQKVVLEPTSVITATGSQGTTGGEINITAQNSLGLAGGGEVQVQGLISAQPQIDKTSPPYISNQPQAPVDIAQAATKSIATASPNTDAANPAIDPAPATPPVSTVVLSKAASAKGAANQSTASSGLPPLPQTPTRPEPVTPALPVSPFAPLSPAGNGYGVGGSIRISAGGRVSVGDGAHIDASGAYGGGEILVGGGWQGLNPNIINSQFTYIASTATLYANADLRGHGGLVVVWANDSAQIYGSIAARGGALGGDGGAIETSGKRWLDVTQVADASAVAGKGGQWLLDPNNVTIQATGPDTNVTGNPSFTTTGDNSIVTVATIQAALNAGISVTITTSAGGAQLGDIVLGSAITTNSATDVSLTLVAHNNISLNANVSATGTGKLNLNLNANSDATGGGAATLASGVTLALNGGTLGSGNGSILNAGTGTLDNVVLATGVNVTGSALKISGGLNFGSGNTITLSASNSELQYIGTQSWSGTGSIVFASTNNYIWGNSSGATLTIGSGITLSSTGSGTAYLGYNAPDAIVLQGVLTANNASKTWQISPGTFTVGSSGQINLSAGTLNLAGLWTNSSTQGIAVSGGVLNLGGTVNATSLGKIAQTGGTVNLTGTLTLDQASTNLSTVGLTGLTLNGGTVNGGSNTLTASTGFALSSTNSTLDNVTLATDLAITGNTYLTNGLTLNASTVTINGGTILYTGTQTLGGTGNLVFGGTSSSWLYRSGTAATLTVGPGITVGGSGTGTAYFGYYSDEAINFQGVLNAGVAGKSWYLGGFNNTGNINVSNGTVYLDTASGVGSWSNTSTPGKGIAVSGGVLNLGDAFNATALGAITQTGGTVNLTGTLTLDQASTNLSTVGLTGLTLNGGTVSGGSVNGGSNTLTASAGFALISANSTLDNVTLATDLAITGNTYLSNGLTLSASTVTINGGTIFYTGSQTLGGTGNLVFGGTSSSWIYRSGTAATLTVGPSITVSGSGTGTAYFGYYSDEAINFQGVLNAGVASKSWYLGGFNNTGNINVSNGTVYLDTASGVGSWSNTSTPGKGIAISGGVLNLGDAFNASALGAITQTGGSVNLTGTLTLDQASTNLSTVGLTGLTLNGGTVSGGSANGGSNTLTASTGFALSSANSTLDNVTLATDLAITGNTYLTNGLTLNASTVTINGGTIFYTGSQTLGGTGNLVFGGTSSSWIYRSGTAATLTVGPGITVSGSGTGTAYFGYYSDEAINFQGVLNAGIAGKSWYMGGFNNTGNINVSNGTVYLDTASGVGSWSNTSTPGKGIAISGGVLNLGDTFLSSGIGLIARSGGTVNLTGTLTNSGTLDIGSNGAFGAGGLSSLTGTIVGGTLVNTDATPNFYSSVGTLDGVTLGSNLNFATNGSYTIIKNSLLLTNGITVNLAGNSLYWGTPNASQQLATVSGTATVNAAGGYPIYAGYGGVQTLTIGNGITLQGYGSISNSSASTIVNYGIISANAPGQTLTISPTTFTNNGTLRVTAGTLSLTPTSWSNGSTGAIQAQGGTLSISGTNLNNTGALSIAAGTTLTLGGNVTTASLGTFTRAAGSTVNLTGTLTNSGTLDIGSNGAFGAGGLSSLTGTIVGGTLVNTDATPNFYSSSGTLDGVTLGSNLNFATNGSYTIIKNSLLLTNGITVNLAGNSLYWSTPNASQQLATVSGSAIVNAAGGYPIYAGYGGVQTLTIGSGITLQGYGNISNSSASTIVNYGIITANASGQTLTINPTTFTNNGTLRVTAGTLSLTPTNWSNGSTGTIQAQGGTLSISGTNLNNTGALSIAAGTTLTLGGNVTTASLGTFTRAAGSTVNLTGTLTNSGTLDIGSNGAFGAGGLSSLTGTIIGGTLINTDATPNFYSSAGTLDGVTLGSNLNFATNGSYTNIKNSLLLTNGITVNLAGNSLYWGTPNANQQLATVSGSAIVNAAGGNPIYAGYGGAQTLTIGSGITLQGYGNISNSSASTIVNYGIITANASGQTLTINPTTFTNNGTLRVTAGTLSLNPTSWSNGNTGAIQAQGGTLSISGTNLSNNGTLSIAAGTTLTLGGNVTTASLGTFTRAAGSTVNLTGTLTNSGTLDIGSNGAFGAGGLSSLTGTIIGGTLINTDATPNFYSSAGTLDGVTLGSNLNFATNGSYTNIKNSLLLTNGITVNLAGNSLYWGTPNASQQLATVSGNATINAAGGNPIYAGYGGVQTLTIGSGITLQGYGSISNSSASTIVNYGIISANAPGQTLTISPTTFTNNGTLKVTAGTLNLSPATATNTGLIQITNGAALTLGNSTNFTSAGSNIDLQSGGVLNLDGTYTISGGLPIVSGATVNLQSGITNAQFSNLLFQGGTAVLNSTLTNSAQTLTLAGTSGHLRLGSGGSIVGGTVATSGGVGLSSTAGTLTGVTLATDMTVENGGSLTLINGLTLSGGKRLILDSSGSGTYLYVNGTGAQTIGGTGSIDFTGTGNTRYVTYYSGTPTLTLGSGVSINALAGGTFWNNSQAWSLNNTFTTNAVGATVSTNLSSLSPGINAAFAIQGGTLQANTAGGTPTGLNFNIAAGASLELSNSAALTLGSGFTATGSGRIATIAGILNVNGMADNSITFAQTSSGTINFDSSMTIGGLEINGGTVAGTGALTVSGASIWNGGTMSGTGSTTFNGPLALSGSTHVIQQRTINFAGTTNWTAGDIYTGNAATLINSGAFLDNTNANITIQNAYGGTASTFSNTGTYTKSGTGTTSIYNAFTNSSNGAVLVNAGTLSIAASSLVQDGLIEVANGAVFQNTGGFTNTGTLAGGGTFNVGAGNAITNNGTIAPGSATADPTQTLSITGDLVQGTNGVVVLELNSILAGDFDSLSVSGSASLNGKLTLNGNSSSGTYSLITASSRTGTFSTIGGTITGTPSYSGTGVNLATFIALVWTGDAGTDEWSNVNNWSTGVLPGANDYVTISSAGSLTLSSGNYSILGLNTTRNFTLSGGASLNLATPSIIGGNLQLNGGTLTGAGTLAIGGSLSTSSASTLGLKTTVSGLTTLSAGGLTLDTGALLTVNGGMNWSGGSINGAGTLLVPVGQTLNITGSYQYLTDITLDNRGSTILNLNADTGNTLYLQGSATFLNSGTLSFSGTNNTIFDQGGSATFVNTGTVLNVGSGMATLIVSNFSSTDGTFTQSGAGSLSLAPVSAIYSGTTTFNGSNIGLTGGSQSFTDGLTINGVLNIAGANVSLGNTTIMGTLNFNSGALALNADKILTVSAGGNLSLGSGLSLGGSGSLINDGSTTFNSNTLSQTIINRASMTLNGLNTLGGGTVFTQESGTLTLPDAGSLSKSDGSVLWTGGKLTGVSNGLGLSGNATLDISGGNKVLDGLTLTVANVSVDTGILEILSGSLSSVATTTIAPGATLRHSGGNLVLSALTNDGTFDAANGVTSYITSGGTHTGTFRAEAGSAIEFSGSVDTSDTFNGATFSGPGLIKRTGSVTLVLGTGGIVVDTDASVNMNSLLFTGSGPIVNKGSLTATGLALTSNLTNASTGTMNLNGGSVSGDFYNDGTLNLQNTVVFTGSVADQRAGVINLPAGAMLQRETGLFQWIGGTIAGAGNLTFTNGGSFAFAGTGVRVIDGLNFSFTDLTLPNGSLTLKSGSLTLNGNTNLPVGVTLNLNGGLLINNGPLSVAGSFSLNGGDFSGTGDFSISAGTGTLYLPATSTVNWTNTGLLTNTGTLNLAGKTITNAIDNQGTINLDAGLVFNQAVTNSGSLVAVSGTTKFVSGLSQQQGGVILLEHGNLTGDITLNAGAIKGSGTINGNLTVGNATLAPGFSPGTISVNGDLILNSNSVLNIELGGLTQGSNYDWVNVSGTATLAGTLNVTSYGDFNPAAGNRFTVMNFANTRGTFAAVNQPAGWNLSLINSNTSYALLAPSVTVTPPPAIAPQTVPVLQQPSLVATQAISVVLERTEEVATFFDTTPLAPQKLVSVKKQVEEEACQ